MAVPNKSTANDTSESLRVIIGAVIAVVGLTVVVIALALAFKRFTTSSDIVAVIGSVTGVVGTVVGAVFGVNVGSAGTSRANAARDKAEDKATKLALFVPQDHAMDAASLLGP